MLTLSSEHALPRPSLGALAEHCYAAAHRALELGDLASAERLLTVLLVARPSDERGWLGLAILAERRGIWQRAAALYRLGSALVADPGSCELGLGRVLARLGRTREAARALDEAERRTDDPARLHAIQRERACHDLH